MTDEPTPEFQPVPEIPAEVGEILEADRDAIDADLRTVLDDEQSTEPDDVAAQIEPGILVVSSSNVEKLGGDNWARYRKTPLTRMCPATGPLQIITNEGLVRVPEGWRGMLALDDDGLPYPVAQHIFDSTYVEANTREANVNNALADAEAQEEYAEIAEVAEEIRADARTTEPTAPFEREAAEWQTDGPKPPASPGRGRLAR